MYPPNLVHIALWHLDRKLLTSPDGKRIDVSLEAICRLLDNLPPKFPPPMLTRQTVAKRSTEGAVKIEG